MGYEELLEEAYQKVKPITSNGERFEIMEIQGMLEGNKTIVTNFAQIASHLRRKPEHLAKFLQRELATPATLEGERLVMQRKIMKSKIQEKLKEYVEEFVLCKECNKPDTELVKQGEFMFIHCMACGAKHSVRAKIQ